MHSCVERFFRVKTPPCPSLEEMLRFYEENWLSDGYESPEEENRYKEYGKDILKKFWEIHSPAFRLPIALEHRFFLNIDGITLTGYIDRVDKLDSGGLSVIDYKTNQELFTADYLNNNLQLTIYQMASEQTWNLPVEMLTLYHLRTNTPCSCPPRDKQQIDEARQLVAETAQKIARGEFPATENDYCPCDFPQYCPYYRHKYVTANRAEEQALLPGIEAAEAVERYAALQAQIKELEEQLEKVKEIIINYCRKEDLNRVYGSDHDITYKIVERSGYNEQDVRSVLEPRGLWERVLSFDQGLLKQLLADKALPADIRKKIESLKNVTSSYPQLRVTKHTGDEEE